MKRLHIVGKSKDNKRLFLAQKKDAKFGSFEIPIGKKLLRLIEEVQEARAERSPSRQAPPANEGDATSVRVLSPEPAEAALPAPADGGDGSRPAGGTRATDPARAMTAAAPLRIADDDLDIPIDPTPGQDAMAPVAAAAEGPSPTPLFEPPVPIPEASPPREQDVEAPVPVRTSRPEPKRRRPEIPARSKLSPAEIQGLIRAGRGVRSVANLAGTPVAWVKYLAEPIQQERLGVVRQMLAARQERTRLGPSSATIGESILANLRGKGIRNPEAIFENGFTAHRPNGRDWRVRLVFDHRGNRYAANWSYDPTSRAVTPLNTLATQLGWRRQPGQDDEAEAKPRSRSTRKSTSSRSKRTPARSKASARKRTTARKKTATRSTSSRRTAAARKTTKSRTSARKSSSRSKSARR